MNNENTETSFATLVKGFEKAKMSNERIQRAIFNLKNNNIDIEVGWHLSCYRNDSQVVPVKCGKCGLISLFTLKILVGGSHTCSGCVIEKYKKILNTSGFDYVSHSSGIMTIKCHKCNSLIASKSSGVSRFEKNIKIKCITCQENEYSKLASNIGFKYLSKCSLRGKGTFTKLICNTCSDTNTVPVSQLYSQYVGCKLCNINEYKTHLKEKDCTLISVETKVHGGIKKCRVTYSNSSGDVFEATSGNILHGKFTNTLKSSWYQKHCTYLITNIFNGTKYCKIGTANNAESRLVGLGLIGESSVVILASFDSRFDADDLETKLHSEFKNYELNKDIASQFTTSTKITKDCNGNKYTRLEGITEWFTSEVEQILLDRYINKIKENNGINTYSTS
jgi:hypothetical protein